MNVTKITPENVHDFPIGTTVLSLYGAYYPEIDGVVIDHVIIPAAKGFPANAYLIVRQDQFVNEFDEIVINETTVSELYENSTYGRIGTYLIEKATKLETKTKSPWAK
jgi:hypothetical protein